MGENSAAHRGQTETGGERGADSGAIEVGRGGRKGCKPAEEEGGEKESRYKVIGGIIQLSFMQEFTGVGW